MLEKELDTELFVRNTRKVTLTDSGELFLEDAKIILDAMEHAKQKVTLAKEQPPYYASAICPRRHISFYQMP
mgnify:CR=1 FL=1